ncbi:MAG: hypothetical protein ACO3T7_02925 [Pseudomonadales bacterium]
MSRAEELSSTGRALEIIQAPNRFIEHAPIRHRFFLTHKKRSGVSYQLLMSAKGFYSSAKGFNDQLKAFIHQLKALKISEKL